MIAEDTVRLAVGHKQDTGIWVGERLYIEAAITRNGGFPLSHGTCAIPASAAGNEVLEIPSGCVACERRGCK